MLSLMHRDMIGFNALDFILRFLGAGMGRLALVLRVFGVHLTNFAADMPCFRVPAHMVASFKFHGHDYLSFS